MQSGKWVLYCLEILGCAFALHAQNTNVTIREELRDFPTYDVGVPSPNPQFDAFHQNIFASYPYAVVTPINKNSEVSQWRVVILENEYLSCRILPDLGGHLHGCTDRITGKEIFFANAAIRRTADQGRGGFASTGIETSFPIAHSRVSGFPVAYAFDLTDGVGRVIAEDTDLGSGMQWRTEFILRPGSAVLEQRGTVYNGSAVRRGYQWWVNAAVELDDPQLRVIYPVKWMMPHGSGPMSAWPIDKGVDLSIAANHKDQAGLFAHLSREPWMAVYKPTFHSGVAHYADANLVKGKKVWFWGGDWDKYFRDHYTVAGSHSIVEMQAGELESQSEFTFLHPGETKTFTHYWIPFHDLGGVSRATHDAVLNLNRNGNSVTVEIEGTTHLQGVTLRFSDGEKRVWEGHADLDPKVKYAKMVDAKTLTVDLLDSSGATLLHHVEGIYDSAPFDANAKNPEPEAPTVNSDEEEASLERGKYNEEREQWVFAWGDYERGLKKNPSSLKLKVAEGRAAVALNRYDDAILLLKDVAGSNTEAAFYYGVALANSERRDREAKAALSTTAQEPVFEVSSRMQLALLAARTGGTSGTAEAASIVQSLAAKSNAPVRVGAMEVALLRRAGKKQEAETRLRYWLQKDPDDDLLRMEQFFGSSNNDSAFWNYLAADPERVLTLAETYRQMGDYADALKLLDHTYLAPPVNQQNVGAVLPQNNPMVLYFRGYCKLQTKQDAKPDFVAASALSPVFVFPHREIDFRILKAALAQNENDAVAHDLLGEMYFYSFRPLEAIAEWKRALALKKTLPALHHNLGLALVQFGKDPAMAAAVLREGMDLTPGDSEMQRALDGLKPPIATADASARTAAIAAGGSSTPVTSAVAPSIRVEGPKGDLAGQALVRSINEAAWSDAQFNQANFPNYKQPPAVLRDYIEVQLRMLFLESQQGNCADALNGLENLDTIKKTVPFTESKFGSFMKEPHYQYYMALLQSKCGKDKPAQKRWEKVSKATEAPDSPDFVFPLLAAQRLGDPEAAQRIEAAFKQVENAKTDDANKPVLAFEKGALLMASGRSDQGRELLQKAAQSGDPFVQYLSLALLAESTGK